MERYWTIRPRAPESHFARFASLPRPIAQLLYNRGLREPNEVEAFLARAATETNPFRMRGMKEAVERIREAITRGEQIVVHGDFDADGVTSTTVMVTGLEALGARVKAYIPHRVDEGYGLNAPAIRRLAASGCSLMVTVDCGIRANQEIALANEVGLEVVVTDHHSPGELPDALAIVNPHQPACPYPYKGFAGVGLAWKTIQALDLAERKRPLGVETTPLDVGSLLDLVALGTVADMVPLTGENRALVWQGLEQLRQTQRVGLLALMESARIAPAAATEESIGFFLGPRINAAGRLAHAKLAYRLLRTRDSGEAYRLAAELEQKNRERQHLTKLALARAQEQLSDPAAPLLMVCDPACPEGIVGLVAGRLLEEYYRPVVVVAQGEEWSRASCRSIPEFHITRALEQVAPLLERYGGHAAAAGFTVRTERLPELTQALTRIAQEALLTPGPDGRPIDLRPRLVADAELPLHEIDESLVSALDALAPFGTDNREPLWMCRNLVLRDARPVGDSKSHLKLTLLDARQRAWSAIAFQQGHRLGDLTRTLDIAFSVKQSEWQGRQRLELQVTDFRPARTP